MADNYTSWKGIVDRRFTGRHLPEDKEFERRTRPETEDLVNLFLRPEDGTSGGTMQPDLRSTLLFASFAQWFTDSFLRTSHAFEFDDETGEVVTENDIPVRQPGREKINVSTHEIDLCQIYGLNKKMTDKLRDPNNHGCLRSQVIEGEEFPDFILSRAPTKREKKLPIKTRFECLHDERVLRHIFKRTKTAKRYKMLFATGLEHSNATIGNALFNTIFLRQHNNIAREIAASEPDWDSDRVFETTRNTMIVILLNIVISDYIRHISPLGLPLSFQPGIAEAETWYRRNRIHIEFNILYRWHGLVPSQFSFLPKPDDSADFRHNNEWLIEKGLSGAISAFSKERAGMMVLGNTPRFLAPVKRDTITIMRSSRLQTYNAYRKRFGLKEAKDFSDITMDTSMAAELSRLYGGRIDDVEWYIGMCAESHGRGMLMGDLMFYMVAHDAFTHALTNPLLSNEVFTQDTFGGVGWKYVQEVKSLKQVVANVVDSSTVCEFAINGIHADRA
ncbi:MAG: peroxidase family protein [Pseudomonadota bacterium]